MSAAAISGTFSDFRTVKGRKVCQLVVEIPVEQADAALRALGGVPQPHDPKWVAIAQLDPNAVSKPAEPKERKAWADLPPSQQAGIRCGELNFWGFLNGKGVGQVRTEEDAASAVKLLCLADSRTELNSDGRKRILWHQLDREFQEWSGRVARG